MAAFVYPEVPHSRRHGPKGYADHYRYHPWLRDEFSFRCVYCLSRERWGKGHYGFHVDHLIPQAKDPSRILDYDNLLYACSTCNSLKRDAEGISDPCQTAYGDSLTVGDDGKIHARDERGKILIKILRLDNDENTEFRHLMLEIIRLAKLHDKELYARLMGFPGDLPDLASRRPPGGNSEPEGVEHSFLARRQRGELEEMY